MGDSHYSKSPQVYDSNSPQDSNSQKDSNSPQECSSQEYSPQVHVFKEMDVFDYIFRKVIVTLIKPVLVKKDQYRHQTKT